MLSGGRDFPLEVFLSDHLHKQTEECSVDNSAQNEQNPAQMSPLTSTTAPLVQCSWWSLADMLWKGRQEVGLGTGARLGRFGVELSDAHESLLSTAKALCACIYIYMPVWFCLWGKTWLDMGKVRNMTSFPSFSIQNIFIFFCISFKFPCFVKVCWFMHIWHRARSRAAENSKAHGSGQNGLDGWHITHNTAQPSIASASLSQSSASYWFGSSTSLSIYIFVLQAVSKHLGLHPVPWAPCLQLCQEP